MQFFVLVNNEQQGPFSVDQLKGYLAMGQFQPTDLAWHEGLPDWKPLGEFPEFAPKAHRTPNYKSVPVRNIAHTKSKKGKGWVGAVVGIVVVGALGGGGYYYWQNYLQKPAASSGAAAKLATNSTETAAANASEPKTAEELNRWYEEPPAGQNAATFFEQGFDALQITNTDRNSSSLPLIGKAQMPPITTPVSSGVKSVTRSFLERNQPALDQFAKAFSCSGSRYPLDFTQGPEVSLSRLTKVKQAAQLGELSALSQADAHQGAGAAQGVLLALTSARTLEAEPVLLSQLTRIACEGSAVEALEQSLNRITLPADSLTQLQTAFDHAADYESAGTGLNRGLVGERVNAQEFIEMPPEKLNALIARMTGVTNALRDTSGPTGKALEMFKEQGHFLVDSLNQLLAARREPLPGRLKADDTITSRAEEAKSKQLMLAAAQLPALAKMTSREAATLARLRVSQTAVALEKFRAANGNKYPDSLNELAPKFFAAVPQDPFDGQPLRYHKAGEGFVIYSLGPDLRDDSGMRKPGSDDLSFIVVKPPLPL